MLNDRDDRHDDHEESEYHFSDEDISYEETEAESSKPANSGFAHESLANRLSHSKRMLGSAIGFFVLVFIVYKIVTPSGSSTQVDINSPLAGVSQSNAPKAKPIAQAATQSPAQPMSPATPTNTQQAVQPVAVNTPTEVLPQKPDVQVQVKAPAQNSSAPTNTIQTQAAMPATPVAPAPLAPQQPNANAAEANKNQIASAPATTADQSGIAQQTAQQSTIGMPAVIPVQSAQPESLPGVANTVPVANSSSPALTIVQSPAPEGFDAKLDAKMASMEATNQKLMSQMQSEYSQKLNDFSSQNKALQDQIQALNSRVAGMEMQLNQLVHAITQQPIPGQTTMPTVSAGGANHSFNSSKQLPPIAQEAKVAFSVQAIIPGRAWLRSDNGEAITVAEGDTIKDFGRVTKIDPYDGVVEVNTGNRVVSLSYGNGAES